jgi:hypothetical protein
LVTLPVQVIAPPWELNVVPVDVCHHCDGPNFTKFGSLSSTMMADGGIVVPALADPNAAEMAASVAIAARSVCMARMLTRVLFVECVCG